MELHVLGKRAVGGAADVDHNDRVHEKAGVQHLHQRLLLDVDREGLLTVAVDDGGDAACPTHGAGGSLARPLARLGRQRKLFAHMHVSTNFGSTISAPPPYRDEFGTATCRERVSTSAQISVVAESIKK